MARCRTCHWSFAIPGDYREEGSVLMCWPDGDREREQLAGTPCPQYQRDPGTEGDDD